MTEPVQTPPASRSSPSTDRPTAPANRLRRAPYPFTRGNFASGYRGKLWTFRQYSGFGTAEESNRRYRYLLDQGGTGLSVALDLPTQCGYDSDDPECRRGGRPGRGRGRHAGRRRDPVRRHPAGQDQHQLHDQRHRRDPAGVLRRRRREEGVPRAKLTGTIQNDILKEYASRGTWIWPPEPSLRLIADTIEFCAAEVPRFNAISVAGAHFRDAGANAVQEMAFTLADGVTYCDTVVERGRMTIDQFAPQISFFFYTHGDFFEEIAKYRRRPAALGHDRARSATAPPPTRRRCSGSAASPAAPRCTRRRRRTTSSGSPTRRWPSVLGGVQSMFTAAWDEPFALPSEESATLALRTQQILAYETGVARWPIRSAAPTSSRRSPTRPRRRSSRSWTTSRRTAAWCAPSRTATCRA